MQDAGVPPCTLPIDGEFPRPLGRRSASTQFALARFRPLPCNPEQLPEAADVFVEFFKHALAGVELEVPTPTARKDLAEFQLEPLGMHPRNTRGARECAAEKLCSSRAKYAALVALDPQLERFLDKLDRVFQHAFPCSPRLHVAVAVVGVSAELQV